VSLLEEGLVALTRSSPDGREVILALRYAGELLETSAVLLGEPHWATAITLSPACARALPSEDFLEAVRIDTDLSMVVQRSLSRQVRDQHDRILALAFDSARQRLEDFLRALAPPEGESSRVQLPFNQTDLSHYVVASRQRVNCLLSDLERDGIISREKGWYVINPARLSGARPG
jgi:CRP/FNR family transcriptional regulator